MPGLRYESVKVLFHNTLLYRRHGCIPKVLRNVEWTVNSSAGAKGLEGREAQNTHDFTKELSSGQRAPESMGTETIRHLLDGMRGKNNASSRTPSTISACVGGPSTFQQQQQQQAWSGWLLLR